MKKIVAGCIISIIILLQCVTVMAAKLENIKMNIELPKEYYDLKAGIDTNDSKIAYYETVLKTTKEELANQYKQNSILYNGISSNLSKQLIIAEAQNRLTKKIFHLHLATEEQLEEVKTELNTLAQSQNMKVEEQKIYQNNGITYIQSTIKNASLTIYQYYTIVNGKGITLSLNTTYTNTQKEELKKVVDTIHFEELEEKAPDYANYIIIGLVVILVVIVIALAVIAFSGKKKEE